MAKVAEKLPLPLTEWRVVNHGVIMHPQPIGPEIVFAHAVLPFEPPRAKNFIPATWFQELLASERRWFAGANPRLMKSPT